MYSTCSIHPEENEHVVKTILKNHPEFELAPRDSILPTWNRRGIPSEIDDRKDLADRLVRTIPAEDLTNGFFVSCFIRKQQQGEKRPLEHNSTNDIVKKKKKNNRKKKTALTQ